MRPGFVTASVVGPFGNVLGVVYNRHYLEVLKRSGLGELTGPSQESQRRMSGTCQGWSCTVVARNANTVSYQTLACCGVRIQWFSSGK